MRRRRWPASIPTYVDLTGGRLGWRNRFSAADFHRLFYWEGAFGKIVFGTDVHARMSGAP